MQKVRNPRNMQITYFFALQSMYFKLFSPNNVFGKPEPRKKTSGYHPHKNFNSQAGAGTYRVLQKNIADKQERTFK